MRPGESLTQLKSMNKNERQGYIQEYNETEHKVDEENKYRTLHHLVTTQLIGSNALRNPQIHF